MPTRSLQHQELLVTLFGLYSGPEGVLKVSSLVALMSGLGIKEGAVRSTVSRLKNRGILEHVSEERPARYRLSDSVLDSFQADDKRIFAPERSRLGDPWALVVFSVPEAERSRRYELRTELSSQGFGFVAAGVAIAPARLLDQALVRLRTQGLDQYIECFRVHYGDRNRLSERVAEWWDLEALDAQYDTFITAYRQELHRWQTRPTQPPALDAEGRKEAFALYIPLLTLWRRFPYRDPNIPLELLPGGWKAPQAKVLFLELHSILQGPAAEYAYEVLSAGT
jgi:phenylacetic acid degradation operon negative regulatory protein